MCDYNPHQTRTHLQNRPNLSFKLILSFMPIIFTLFIQSSVLILLNSIIPSCFLQSSLCFVFLFQHISPSCISHLMVVDPNASFSSSPIIIPFHQVCCSVFQNLPIPPFLISILIRFKYSHSPFHFNAIHLSKSTTRTTHRSTKHNQLKPSFPVSPISNSLDGHKTSVITNHSIPFKSTLFQGSKL